MRFGTDEVAAPYLFLHGNILITTLSNGGSLLFCCTKKLCDPTKRATQCKLLTNIYRALGKACAAYLFHSHRFCQITRLIHVAATANGHVIGQQLHGDNRQQGS